MATARRRNSQRHPRRHVFGNAGVVVCLDDRRDVCRLVEQHVGLPFKCGRHCRQTERDASSCERRVGVAAAASRACNACAQALRRHIGNSRRAGPMRWALESPTVRAFLDGTCKRPASCTLRPRRGVVWDEDAPWGLTVCLRRNLSSRSTARSNSASESRRRPSS